MILSHDTVQGEDIKECLLSIDATGCKSDSARTIINQDLSCDAALRYPPPFWSEYSVAKQIFVSSA